ncbi:MAG: hypothetical protein WKF97_11410 [Chitinophagaceae bacterium]
MSTRKLTCEAAKNLDMVDYLELLGFLPQKIKNNDFWYLSQYKKAWQYLYQHDKKLKEKWIVPGLKAGKG